MRLRKAWRILAVRWEDEWDDHDYHPYVVHAPTASKAKYKAALNLQYESGYFSDRSLFETMRSIRAVRHRENDLIFPEQGPLAKSLSTRQRTILKHTLGFNASRGAHNPYRNYYCGPYNADIIKLLQLKLLKVDGQNYSDNSFIFRATIQGLDIAKSFIETY